MKDKLLFVYLLIIVYFAPLLHGQQFMGYEEPDTSNVKVRVGKFDETLTGTEKDTGWGIASSIMVSQFKIGNDIWFKSNGPAKEYIYPGLYLNGFFYKMDIYIDSTCVFSTDTLTNIRREKTSTVIPLKINPKGKTVYIRMRIESNFYLGLLKEAKFGSVPSLLSYKRECDKKEIDNAVLETAVGSTILFLGLFSLFIFLNQIKQRLYPFLLFGIICFTSGYNYLTNPLSLTGYLNITHGTLFFLSMLSVFILAPVFVYFLEMMFGAGWKKLLRRLWQFSALFGFLFTIALLFDISLAIHFPDANIVYSIEIFLIVLIFIKSGYYKNRDAWPMLLGIMTFMVFAMLDLLKENLNINWAGSLSGWGILLWAFSLMHVLLKYYVNIQNDMKRIQEDIRIKEDEVEQLREDNIRSQYEALKNQVNPHFMFNTFSTLIDVIEDSPEQAADFVQKLSNVYRYVLLCKDKQVIDIGSELDFVYAYSFLLEKRFGNGFQLHVDVPENVKSNLIIPLGLQILIENTIKHNIVSTKKPLQIDIFTDKNNEYLSVRNTLQRKNSQIPSTKVGLNNIISRYQYFTNLEVKVIENDLYFTVQLPILSRNDEYQDSNN
ncbi:MAG: histidine kinase [Ignavibacteria bacterium]|nr:histidine kinase [Ignavibacteria bacterium]